MWNNMKRIFVILLVIINFTNINAQTSTDVNNAISVVTQFGNEISLWCRDKKLGDFGDCSSHWYRLTALTSGAENCIINDDLVKKFRIDAVRDTVRIDIENYICGVLDDQIMNGITFRMSNVKMFKGDVPRAKKEGPPPVFIQADMEFSGSLNMKMSNVFWVRDGKIVKVESDTSKMSQAQRAYASRNYETAFKLFRELAYESFTNYEAQYYTALMEIYKDGCKGIMSDDIRDYEAYVWIIHILSFSNNQSLTQKAASVLLAYSMSAKPDETTGLIATQKPIESNRLLFFDKSRQKYGFKDLFGRVVIPCIYNVAYPFSDGRAAVITENGTKCYIDPNGNVVTSAYDGISAHFYMGRSFVLTNGTAYLIDKFDKRLVILKDKYKTVDAGICKYTFLTRSDGLIDVYNFSGTLIFPKVYSVQIDTERKKVVITESNGKKTYCDFSW